MYSDGLVVLSEGCAVVVRAKRDRSNAAVAFSTQRHSGFHTESVVKVCVKHGVNSA